jgi:hypothetical protein
MIKPKFTPSWGFGENVLLQNAPDWDPLSRPLHGCLLNYETKDATQQ